MPSFRRAHPLPVPGRSRTTVEPLESRLLLCALTHQIAPSAFSSQAADEVQDEVQAGDEAPAAAGVQWSQREALPMARFEAQGAVLDGQLYVMGGFHNNQLHAAYRVDAFDPQTNTWTRRANMRDSLTHAGQAVDGSLMYVAGGFLGDHPGGSISAVRIYDASTDSWSSGPSLPADRGGGALVRLDRTLHYFGGATREAGATNYVDHGDHWVLELGDTASTSDDAAAWTAAAPLPNPRNHIGGAAVGGKVYAVGGQHGENEVSGNQRSVHAYDPATDTWSAAEDLPLALGHLTASTFELDGMIVTVGGVTQEAAPVDRVFAYRPGSAGWAELPRLPGARQSPVAGVIGNAVYVAGGKGVEIAADTFAAPLGGQWRGADDGLAQMPVPLAEVAGGIIGGKIYLVGGDDPSTLVYDIEGNTWSTAAQRPHPGDHHAAEVHEGRLYLFGGFGGGSEGAVQIYDPGSNTWTSGAQMPFAAGSSSSAVIGQQIYVAGGIAGSSTTHRAARYDPQLNIWTEIAPMPQGRNHAAAETDGQKLWIFGGRGSGSGNANSVANGFDTVQVYDPATNTWTSSKSDPALAPLPQARGGMGKAVYLNGRFYIMGGETLTGAGATLDDVYDRMDVYDPASNAWSDADPLPTARHGIFPLAHDGTIYIAGGGVRAGGSASTTLEAYTPAALLTGPPPPGDFDPDPIPDPAPAPDPHPDPDPAPNSSTVVGRHIFYNNSIFDGNDPAAGPADDAAIAPDKQALLPGQQATFANYTSYAKGINGIMIDIAGLPENVTLTGADFVVRAGNSVAPMTWTPAPAPAVSVRRGAGVNGSDRVTLIWPDGRLQRQWIEVSIASNANTALAGGDVFYFGNAIGETGNNFPLDAAVNGKDRRLTKKNRAPSVDIGSVYDFDRNGAVDKLDMKVAKKNRTKKLKILRLITSPVTTLTHSPVDSLAALLLRAESQEKQ